MKLALASDHAGFEMKQHLVEYLRAAGHEIFDLGVQSAATRSDYPDVAKLIGETVAEGSVDRGILVCGSGVGASIAANKVKGVFAAICHDTYSAAQGVEHDNMNILCLGGRVIGMVTAETLADAFIGATFQTSVERYVERFEKVRRMDER
jgi:ribose 5-phosphate isomerase B